jgi:hypothetical protein
MNRIRGGAFVLGLAGLAFTVASLATARTALAQEITGRVTGRVVDQDNGQPLAGVTVIVQGPQGEDATTTDDKGQYLFTSLGVGTYTVRFFVGTTNAQVEQEGVVVSAEKTVRVNAKMPSGAETAGKQVYVITGRASPIDVGSARVGTTFDQDFTLKVPNGRTYGDVIQKAPGVFLDPSGNISVNGATGLENIYNVNGLNVTGMMFGNLDMNTPSLGGGTNLPIEFLTQIDVNGGGYNAEYGGAMGGVVNTVLKSGTNEFHGSVFGYWQPYWLSAEPTPVTHIGGAIGSLHKPDFSNDIGFEVGGPLIKDKLFFWAGFAPNLTDSHVFRLVFPQMSDGMGGTVSLPENMAARQRINETRRVWNYAATVDYAPTSEHHLTFALLGTPSTSQGVRSVPPFDSLNSNPAWAQESLTKTNTDLSAHWTSKLFDRRWQIDAIGGAHLEYFNDRSPWSTLNAQNQLEYWGANLWDLERLPGCEPTASTPTPCPVDNYHTGGFGLAQKYSAERYTGEIKSTHLFELIGHNELKWGWHGEFAFLDQDRYYSGPIGDRALVQLAPTGGLPAGLPYPYVNTYSFFTVPPGMSPLDYGMTVPRTDLFYPPGYRDDLKADVASFSHAFFLQDSWTPQWIRNLTINAGVRIELQRMDDTYGKSFLDTTNLGPRVGAIYDPFADGKSKISASYGRYFEAIPMNIAARYFGGEGILIRNGVALSDCKGTTSDPYSWTGAGDWRNCGVPPMGSFMDKYASNTFTANNGADYPVQTHLAGQYHNEVVATVERQVMDDMTARIDYVHRWLGTIIEDGAADPSLFAILANPGHIPPEAIQDAQNEVNRLMMTDQTNAQNASDLATAQGKLAALKALQTVPKPERTYDALTLSVNKRFSRNWQLRASYTYSRLVGNYEGLYQYEQNYFAPNGANAYDTPDLNINNRGVLPNDRPHLLRADGSYSYEIGRGRVTLGLSAFGQSGIPRNYMSGIQPGQQLVFLLPRGEGGRTPWMTQVDTHISYGRPLTPSVSLEAFIDLFNIFNEQAALQDDDNYTFNIAAPIQNGTTKDLKFAKDVGGNPIKVNANYGHPVAYQLPFHGRMGLRLTF